ncbi:MAG: P-loop containing nucleoside triphosphate hydrolase protein, partial [Linnemannia elongata]
MPWYGNVNDITDPYVVTISPRYLKTRIGEEHDPEEYVKELELQNRREGDGDLETDISQDFRVNLEYILRKVWGYPSFRDGQLDSIKRTLRHESSLLVLPTGSGKSLSYQLPAYILSKLGIPTLTLVISPMISLMYDQVKCLPPGLIGACWTSVEQTTTQFRDFMEKLTSNTIKILFISPEKLQSQSFLSLVRTRKIPPIPFVCVDEVHCLSEWSHNFRPAYLLLNHVLISDLKSPCVIGLTGTATEGTKDSICAMLHIDRSAGVLSGPVIRDNLAMTVSVEADREPALLNLLQSPRFAAMDAILIYVMRQAQADALAAFLRVRNFSAESYHAGKSSQDRQRIQHRFMNDRIRILVATIAFGLGLNKSNIRSVIHYCLPKSLENYIQEIGRSGRDGEKSYCHMFLNQDD